MQGNIDFNIPAMKGNIVRPERIINSLNQVIAVNWMTSSETKITLSHENNNNNYYWHLFDMTLNANQESNVMENRQ